MLEAEKPLLRLSSGRNCATRRHFAQLRKGPYQGANLQIHTENVCFNVCRHFILGGSRDFVNCWGCNPTCSLSNWPYVGYATYDCGCKPRYKQLLRLVSLQIGYLVVSTNTMGHVLNKTAIVSYAASIHHSYLRLYSRWGYGSVM